MFTKKSQDGQIIVILLLLMLVALSIGIAMTQKSVTDVATSTQTEQSSRAFSAAEAGIEKALSGTLITGSPLSLGNGATATVDSSNLLPLSGSSAAIEYPKIGRETTAQFWLIDPKNEDIYYSNGQINLYFGNESTADLPAIEVKIVMRSNGNFYSKTYYYDSDPRRRSSNNFTTVYNCGSKNLATGILGDNHKFFCTQTIPAVGSGIPDLADNPPQRDCITSPAHDCKLILARARLLYANENHKIALEPVGAAKFPPQIQIYNSRGISGQSEKQIQAFKVKDVVPPWFDFAVFSVNQIDK